VHQPLFPHSKHKRKTTQTKKETISKAPSVVCNFIAPHQHKESKRRFAIAFKRQTGKFGQRRTKVGLRDFIEQLQNNRE